MRKLSLLLVLLISFVSVNAKTFQNETLHYVVSYKWGLIHKDAGEATLTLRNNGARYDIKLTARTKPWADKIYQVRDTLSGSIRISDFKPLTYVKATHEKGKYKRDEIKYTHTASGSKGVARRYRYDKGREEVTEKTFTSTGPVYDMLSVFYFLRQLDFNNLNRNKIYTATIFSGKQKETIKIRSLGLEKIKMKDKTEREAFHIRFNFTKDGSNKSSDDMDTWISSDEAHIPLYLVAKLPFGEVRGYYIP